MGDKVAIDHFQNRISKAFYAAWEVFGDNEVQLEVLANQKGYYKIASLDSFAVYNPPIPHNGAFTTRFYEKPDFKFRGLLEGAFVFTSDTFNENIIELRDTKGTFTYTLDLSE